MKSVCQEAQMRTRAAALMRTKIATVARLAVRSRLNSTFELPIKAVN